MLNMIRCHRSYILMVCVVLPHGILSICWDTGCQRNDWLVKGCEQYGMTEIGNRICENGHIYSCCDKTGVGRDSRPGCWDTGCQRDDWLVKGCEQYGMMEIGNRICENGHIYSCCRQTDVSSTISPGTSSSTGSAADQRSSVPTCWDTGCQRDDWLVKGCEQYAMKEVRNRICENGHVYSCCDKAEAAVVSTNKDVPNTEPTTSPKL